MTGAGDIPSISLADHPRAGAAIRRTKAWGGLAAFAITCLAGHMAGLDAFSVGLRALLAGIVGYFVFWSLAVGVWSSLVRAETKAAIEHVKAKRAEHDRRAIQASSES
jgi:hypothetical protein